MKPRALLLDRIAAQKRAHSFREVRTRFPGMSDALLGTAREKFGVAAPFGGPTSSGMLTLHCPPKYVHALASFLREHGAEAVSVAALDYVYSRDNPLYAKLAAELEQGQSTRAKAALPNKRATKNRERAEPLPADPRLMRSPMQASVRERGEARVGTRRQSTDPDPPR